MRKKKNCASAKMVNSIYAVADKSERKTIVRLLKLCIAFQSKKLLKTDLEKLFKCLCFRKTELG